MEEFDLIVIGAGPGGYVAAIRAAQLGMKVAIVEKEHLGGICLNWGCIPTKALLRAAEIYHIAKHGAEFGIECKEVKVNFARVIERSRAVAAKLSQGIEHLLKKNKVKIFKGFAKFLGQDAISIFVENQEVSQLKGHNFIIATGARPKSIAGLEPDDDVIWTYKESMTPKKMPQSLLVVGSGAIGIEFASFYNMLGADVTVVEVADRILSAEDEEIALMATKYFIERGMKIHTSAQVEIVEKSGEGVKVKITTKNGVIDSDYEKVIVAAGVQANIENIGLENTRVQLHNNAIKTDQYCQTDDPKIWAIGDVTSPPWLAHKASHEAVICVEKIANLEVHGLEKKNIPGCTYCYPQIASVGYTEKQARDAGFEINIGRFPLIGNGKAVAIGEVEGLVKTIYEAKTGELLGAHMIGAEVTEMIQGFVIAKTLETTEAEIMRAIFPHPTISETMHESTLAAYQRAIHI